MSGAKIVVAPNGFKESLTAFDACLAISRGVRLAWPEAEIVERPLADGGDGTLEVLVASTGGTIRHAKVLDPLGREVRASFGILGDGTTGVVEMSRASGLALLAKKERNPLQTTSIGTGQLIRAALDAGMKRLVVGIGGSATNDAGMGMAQALGARFRDGGGVPLEPVGKNLEKVRQVDLSELDARLADVEITVACDVENPLYGPNGAAYVYAPQKGACPTDVERLDKGLRCWAEAVEGTVRRSFADQPGMGAAGGLGAALAALLGAELKSGVELVMDLYGLDADLRGSCLAVTGEGKLDDQTVFGKAPALFAARAKKAGVPTVAIAGSIEGDRDKFREKGISACFSMATAPMTLDACMARAETLLTATSEEVIRLFRSGRKLGEPQWS